MHGNLVLRSCQGKPDALLAGQERTPGQFLDNIRQLWRAKRAVCILTLRKARSFRYERHGTGTLTANPLQHGEVISRADSQIASNDLPFAFIGQNAGKESSAIIAGKMLFSKRQ
ncbi:MAG TPA: hypothetical protein VN578_10275 [Candidatus Binatia bacterium]|nr:hypothetical protein [Candidatus Binatia bacterium]